MHLRNKHCSIVLMLMLRPRYEGRRMPGPGSSLTRLYDIMLLKCYWLEPPPSVQALGPCLEVWPLPVQIVLEVYQ